MRSLFLVHGRVVSTFSSPKVVHCHFAWSKLLNNKKPPHRMKLLVYPHPSIDLQVTMKLLVYPVCIYIYIFFHNYIAIFVSAITCSLYIYMSHIQLQMTSNHIFGASLRLSNVFMWVDSRFYGVWKSSRWFTMAPWLRWSVHIPKMLMESCIIFDAKLMAICICYICRWNGRCWWNIVPNDFHDNI